MRLIKMVAAVTAAAALGCTGCKTEVVNQPPAQQPTVIHEHDAGPSNPPPVENNIKVDR